MNEPKTLKLKLPADPGPKDSTLTAEGKTLNIVLADADRLFYYMGSNSKQIDPTRYNPDGIRRVIMQKKNQVAQNYGNADKLVILIRPTPRSSYQNVVDILDEMMICNVKRYVLMDEQRE